MRRRVTVAALAVGLLAGAVGCRSSCGDRGLFGRRDHCEPPCQLTGRGSASCSDIGAMPPGAMIGGPGMTYPGAVPGGELPMPAPGGTIPPQGIPYAPPAVAPPPPEGPIGVLPVPQVGVPVRNVR